MLPDIVRLRTLRVLRRDRLPERLRRSFYLAGPLGPAQTKLARQRERSLAERKGFEPLEAFRLQRFSRPPP